MENVNEKQANDLIDNNEEDLRNIKIPLEYIADKNCKKKGCYGRGHTGKYSGREDWIICSCVKNNFYYVKRAGRKDELLKLVNIKDLISIDILIEECKNLALTGKTKE